MLHEVLLALSGHASPLFDPRSEDFPFTTVAERALLGSVGHLANLHRALRSDLTSLTTSHPSTICRAVANSILSYHLSQFQQVILDAECQILSKDANCVGAYNIVPLAGVVNKFNPWKRKLEWFRDLTDVMLPRSTSIDKVEILPVICSGAAVINYLRRSTNTGYTDIAEAAVELERVADGVWIRFLSTWILHGQLPSHGIHDFFIQVSDRLQPGQTDYIVNEMFRPSFLDDETASSIMFLGKAINFFEIQLHQIRSRSQNSSQGNDLDPSTRALSAVRSVRNDHMHYLTKISTPIKSTNLATIIKDIRQSLSHKLAEEVLPVHELNHTFSVLCNFFLGVQADFSDTLIEEADIYIAARHKQLRIEPRDQPANNLAGVVMKQAEVAGILSRTWARLAPLVHKGEILEDEFEWAREHLRLSLSKYTVSETLKGRAASENQTNHNLGMFHDLLLGTPATLNIELGSTFGLFLSSADLQKYSAMHTYLLAIRRGEKHTTRLWRQAPLRKDIVSAGKRYTGKQGESLSSQQHGRKIERSRAMRKVWASSSVAVFTLSELGGYLVGSVIQHSWHEFSRWALQSTVNAATQFTITERSASSNHAITQGNPETTEQPYNWEIADNQSAGVKLPKDPEALVNAHRQYLVALTTSLLLNDDIHMRHLRTLLNAVDLLVGFMERSQRVQSNLDLHDEATESEYLHKKLMREEEFLGSEIRKASDKIDAASKSLIDHLRHISTTRLSTPSFSVGSGEFKPWDDVGSIEKLLLKLDLANQVHD